MAAGGIYRVPWIVLSLCSGVLLREHRTQPGTLERDCEGFGVRRFLIFPISLRNVQSTTKVSKNNIVPVSPGQAGVAQVGPQQVRPIQTGIGQVGPGQVGLGHLIGGSEIGAIASAGATDFVASSFRYLANRMQGGRTM